MTFYVDFVKEYMILSAFIQFAILGTAGEVAGAMIAAGRKTFPFSLKTVLLKAAAWGFLGIVIKYAFTGFYGFPDSLVHGGLLPAFFKSGVAHAAAVSIFMNVLFGPQTLFFHRLTDNMICRESGYAGMKNSLVTLLWFWIPAHTVTFLLPSVYRVGLAALWSVSLGCIMGFYKRRSA